MSETLDDAREIVLPRLVEDEADAAVEAVDSYLTEIQEPKIMTDAAYQEAALIFDRIGLAIKSAEAERLKMTRPLDSLKKLWTEKFAEPISRMKAAQEKIGDAMLHYRERKRREEEIAIAKRLDEERQRRADEAEAARLVGNDSVAEAIETAPMVIQTPTPEVPKASGVVPRRIWTFEVVDAKAVPREFCCPDLALLKAVAVAQKERASIPGVRFYAEEKMVRTGR